MKKLKYISISLLSVFSGLFMVSCVIVDSCLFLQLFGMASCGTEIFQEVFSPNGKYKAVLFQFDCGATTGFSTNVSIIRNNKDLGKKRGNIFSANGHPDWFSITLRWLDDQNLIIEHNGKVIPLSSEDHFGNIKIQYVENLKGIMPSRTFKPKELLLPIMYFPEGWTFEEGFPIPEEIKGWNENHPYRLYIPPGLTSVHRARHSVIRLDNIDEAVENFQFEQKSFEINYKNQCNDPVANPTPETFFQSEYSKNFAIGYTEHEYGEETSPPSCRFIAQYDEFYIEFTSAIGEKGMTTEQFNQLTKIIDEIMTDHLTP